MYPTATPHNVRCYLKGGVFADSVKAKLGTIANGAKPKAAKKGGKAKAKK